KTDNYNFYPVYSLDDDNTQKYIKERFKYDDGDGRKYMKSTLVNSLYRPNIKYVFKGINPPKNGWLYSESRMNEMYNSNEIIIPDDPNARLYRKIYLDSYKGQVVQNIWLDIPIVNPMAKEQVDFKTQKPEKLLERIISCSTKEGDLILDFCMGSATTQAVAHKMNRQYIGVEQMDYINDVSVPRLQKVIEGEQSGISKDVEWQGGGSFVYVELMEKNRGFLTSVQNAKTTTELHDVFTFMLEEAEIDFRVDLEAVKDTLSELSFNDQKKTLIKIIDKNQLYFNYSEIDDENVRYF